MRRRDTWTPGPIYPSREPRTVPISIRMPRDLYEELGRYAKRVGAKRTYLILECLRRLLAAKAVGAPPCPTPAKPRKGAVPRTRRPARR
jgi:hypothetical protein